MNNRFQFGLAELLILVSAIAVLAAESRAVGFPIIAFAVLATLAVLIAHRHLPPSPFVLLLSVPLLVLLIVFLLLPDVQ